MSSKTAEDHITPEEFRSCLNEILETVHQKPAVSEADFQMMVHAMDEDGNGLLELDEFRAYSKKYGYEKIPPYEASSTGSRPELKVVG